MNISVNCTFFRDAAKTTDNLALKYRMIIKKYSWKNVSKETTKFYSLNTIILEPFGAKIQIGKKKSKNQTEIKSCTTNCVLL